MRIFIILLLFLAPFLSYSATTISAISLYGVEGKQWAGTDGNSYTASYSELRDWCISWRTPGPGFTNSPSCSRLNNGGVRQGYPLIVGFEPGAIYDKNTACKIEISVGANIGSYYGSGGLVGFTQSSTSTSGNGGSGYLAWFSATFNNCREAVMDLGIKNGYGSGWNYKTDLYTGNPDWAKMCIYVDNQNIGCSESNVAVTPPEPAVCNISIPLTLDYGVVNSKEVDGTQRDISIDYQCNKSATVSFSLLGGTPNNSGVTLNMGGGLTSELCFMSGTSCPSTGGANITTTGKTGPVKLQSTLRGQNISGDDYSASVTVVSAFY